MTRLEPLTNLFDMLHHYWENPKMQRRVAKLLIIIFLGSLFGIELRRQGLLPEPLASITPDNHFHAANLAFSMLLVLEVMSLVFVLPQSVTKSLGKQFEILTLILLRNSFKELSHMHEPIDVVQDLEAILHVLTSSMGALVVFILLGLYYRMHRYQGYLRDPMEMLHYVMAKKILGLGLFVVFVAIGGYNVWDFVVNGEKNEFFHTFYTVLIFADILLVLIAQRYMPSFHAVFRNSGYLIATLFIRIALSAPPYYDAAVGIGAAVFALAVTYATNVFHSGSLSPAAPLPGPKDVRDERDSKDAKDEKDAKDSKDGKEAAQG